MHENAKGFVRRNRGSRVELSGCVASTPSRVERGLDNHPFKSPMHSALLPYVFVVDPAYIQKGWEGDNGTSV